jgi:8-oxo-dGTP pyrophosphatase MutT (NUDIX family)
MNTTYVAQKAIVIGPAEKLLALRRSSTAPTNALKWDLPGGDLEYGENPIEAIAREIREETGLDTSDLKVFDVSARIDGQKEHWTSIAYYASTDKDEITLSFEHDQYQWVTKEEFLHLDLPPKIRKFIENFQENGRSKTINQ